MRVVNMRLPSRNNALLAGLIVAALVFSEVSAKTKEKQPDEKRSSGRKSRGIWIGGNHQTGMDHGHGHGWMKLHTDRHHGHSTKHSEAYVKFHGLGEKGSKQNNGIFARLGNALKVLGIGRGDPDEENNNSGQSGWGSNNDNNNRDSMSGGSRGGWGSGGGQQAQPMITISMPASAPGGPQGGGGGWGQQMSGGGGGGASGGWGAPPSMMQMQSGWANPQMQMVVAQPTGWASGGQSQQSSGSSSGGGSKGGNNGGNNRQTGWASGDFSSYRPPKGGNNSRNKGHFQLNFPTGKPAYIQKLTPIIDLPKIALHGWRR